jgi:hypothetical protein
LTVLARSSAAGCCFSDAVLAHAIVLGSRIGILDEIAAGNVTIGEAAASSSSSRGHLIDAVIRTLWASDAATIEDASGKVTLTALGEELYRERDIFVLWLDAYSDLMSYWLNSDATALPDFEKVVKGDTVAIASAAVGSRYLDEDVLALLADLNPRGTLCDIGCGNARRLVRLCKAFDLNGIGIDISSGALLAAEPHIAEARRSGIDARVELGDATRLQGCYPEVAIVMQTFMTHHITPDSFCESVLRTYPLTFPNAEYFLFFDTTTSEDKPCAQLFAPGFDYIHRLQGLRPRTRSEILSVFEDAQFELLKEVTLRVPNSYAWVLKARG